MLLHSDTYYPDYEPTSLRILYFFNNTFMLTPKAVFLDLQSSKQPIENSKQYRDLILIRFCI